MTWKPPEVLQAERDERVRMLTDKILFTIRDNPIPAEEVLAALCGCAVNIVGINVEQYSRAQNLIVAFKKQMRDALHQAWPGFKMLREQQERKHERDNAANEGTSSEAPQEDPASGGVRPDGTG